MKLNKCVAIKMKDDIKKDAQPYIEKIKKALPAICGSAVATVVLVAGMIWLVDYLTAVLNDRFLAVLIAMFVIVGFIVLGCAGFLYLQDKYKVAVEACK